MVKTIKNGAFFKFGGTVENCVHLGAGLFCPSNTAEAFIKEYNKAIKKATRAKVKEYGAERIIRHALVDFEGNLADTLVYLSNYNFPEEDIVKVYKKLKINW